jgi:hypothetical protein
MALLVIEGFEQYAVGESQTLNRGGWSSNTPITDASFPIKTGRHSGGQAVELAGNGANLFHNVAATDVFTCGFAYRMVDSGPDGTIMVNFRNLLIDHLRLQITAAGELRLDRGTTQLDITSGQGLTQGTWYYFEISATIHNSAGAYDVHIDGSQVFSDTGVDTQNGGVTQVDNFEFVGDATLDPEIDDIYFLDDAGSDNTGLLGDCRVETVFPDSDGNETDFTPLSSTNNSNVDDGLVPDDESSYNSSATVTDRDLYGFAALSGGVGTVFGVDVKLLVRKEDAGFREIRTIARSNVTEVESGNLTLGVEYVYKNFIYENDPDGGGDWDEAAVNAAEFGIDLQT